MRDPGEVLGGGLQSVPIFFTNIVLQQAHPSSLANTLKRSHGLTNSSIKKEKKNAGSVPMSIYVQFNV